MIIKYNNSEYYFDESLNKYLFVNLDYDLPIEIWEQASNGIFKEFTDGMKIKLLLKKNEIENSNNEYFIYNNKKYWFNKDERASLLSLIDSFSDNFLFILDEQTVSINTEKAKQFLHDLNVYSYNCLLTNTKNKEIILKGLDNEWNSYPNKLSLNDYLAS